MKESTFTLNGQPARFTPGQTILEAARDCGVQIPTLCHLEGTIPSGACRICLVEVEGLQKLVTACSTPAEENMVIWTDSPRVFTARRAVLELLLSSGRHNCAVASDSDDWTAIQTRSIAHDEDESLCPAWGDCRLQKLAFAYQVRKEHIHPSWDDEPPETMGPMIIRDRSRCILCGRCVKACNEVQVNRAIQFGYRGGETRIVAGTDRPLAESDCVFCGECIQACPVGALVEKKAKGRWRPWEVEKIRTTCPYCGVGCQQMLHVKDRKIVKVTGVENAQPNQGRLCVKGRFGYDFIYSKERLTTPLIRENDGFREASWEEAIDLTATRFESIIRESGPDALAGVSCARSINEDSYQMQKLFRAVFKTNNIDHCART